MPAATWSRSPRRSPRPTRRPPTGALQGKYPSVLGSQSLVVKRVDLGKKGVYYRAFAGPFSSADQATQVCDNLKAAGGPQCIIQRN